MRTSRRITCRSTPSIRLLGGIALGCALAAPVPAGDLQELKALSLEQLANLEVSIVGKRPARLSDTAAAVFVITSEDIRRSTATRLPELLRMVPGLNVARLDAAEWAISARGFNGRYANKLLVMVDGRSVYAPIFSGTLWVAQDLLLEDIERIEVIRGPGAATWGANAVNGVINVITKSAAQTRGTLATALLGNAQRGTWLRHGAAAGTSGSYRIYAKGYHREPFTRLDGSDNQEDWVSRRGGFRADWALPQRAAFTLQGDAFYEDADNPKLRGANLLGRWEHPYAHGAREVIQFYYDRTQGELGEIGHQNLDRIDLEYRRELAPQGAHTLSFGLGYRWLRSDFTAAGLNIIREPLRKSALYSGFLQDEIELTPEKLRLTLGAKLEHNDYTGLEIQPSARLSWRLQPQTHLWGAISRAIRTPSRGEHDLIIGVRTGDSMGLPEVNLIGGDPELESEELLAYELGLRTQPTHALGLDLALFYNDYDNLATLEPRPEYTIEAEQILLRTLHGNNMQGETYGLELALDWRPCSGWRLQTAYSYLMMQLTLDPNSGDLTAYSKEYDSPRHQLSLHAAFDLSRDTELDAWAYYVDYPEPNTIGSYASLDLRLAHRYGRHLGLELVGRNLFDPHHPEFGDIPFSNDTQQVDREVFVKLNWRH